MHHIDDPGRGRLIACPEDAYHADIARSSNSSIGRFISARREYVAEYVTRTRKRKWTPALGFGGLFHAMTLAPHEMDRYAVAPSRRSIEPDRYKADDPDGDKRALGNENPQKAALKEFREGLNGRAEVDPADAKLANAMVQAIGRHEAANDLIFAKEGLREQTAVWTCATTGRLMRCRMDLVFPERNLIVDLKTFSSREGEDLLADPHAFAAHCFRYSYHRQAAIYLDAFYAVFRRNATFAFVFVEKHNEPRVSVQRVETDSIPAQIGRSEYLTAIESLAECEVTGDWRVPAELEVVDFAVPQWKRNQHEFSGEADYTGVDVE